MTSTPKTLDCLKLKRDGQDALRRRLAGMTPDQQLAFWTQQAQSLRAQQHAAQATAAQPSQPARRAG